MGKNGERGIEWFKRIKADLAIDGANAASSTLARKYARLESEYGIRKAMLVIEQNVVYLVWHIIRDGRSCRELKIFI